MKYHASPLFRDNHFNGLQKLGHDISFRKILGRYTNDFFGDNYKYFSIKS